MAPAKEGYTFVGWQDENGNMLDDTTVATQDAVYTPVYEKNLYPITLVPSDHVALGVLPESAMAGVGDVVTIGTLAEVGYEAYYVCVYYQKDGAMVPVAITPPPATDWANDGLFGDGWHLFGILYSSCSFISSTQNGITNP